MGAGAGDLAIKNPRLPQLGSSKQVGAGLGCAKLLPAPYVGGHVQEQVKLILTRCILTLRVYSWGQSLSSNLGVDQRGASLE